MMKFDSGITEITSEGVVVKETSKFASSESIDDISDEAPDHKLPSRPAKMRRIESDFVKRFTYFMQTGMTKPATTHNSSNNTNQDLQNNEFKRPASLKRALNP